MCRFCDGATKISARPYLDTIFRKSMFQLPTTWVEQVQKMPLVEIQKKGVTYYQPFYKKGFSFCPYCGRAITQKTIKEEKQQ